MKYSLSRIYSPSRGGTEIWLDCPRKWSLAQRWVIPDPWSPEKWMGLHMHADLAEHYGAPRQPRPAWERDTPGFSEDRAREVVARAVQAARGVPVVNTGDRVVAVEQAMGEEQCHPDLVVLSPPVFPAAPMGTLSVVDWKMTMALPPEYVSKKLREYETAWQLWHYAWRVRQHFQLPVTHYTVVLIRISPTIKTYRVDVPVSEGALRAWERGARDVWWAMAHGAAWPNYHSCLKYRGCPFYTGCHTLEADESKFEGVYQRC